MRKTASADKNDYERADGLHDISPSVTSSVGSNGDEVALPSVSPTIVDQLGGAQLAAGVLAGIESRGVGVPVWYIIQNGGQGWKLGIDERLALICEKPYAEIPGTSRPLGWSKPTDEELIRTTLYWQDWDWD